MRVGDHLALIVITTAMVGASSSRASARPTQPDAVFERHGLGGDAACLTYVDADAVEYRKDRWRAAIDELSQDDPKFVLDWIIGAIAPPRTAAAEATMQRDCLIDMLIHDAADPTTRLILDHQRDRATKSAMGALGERYRASPRFRRDLRASLTESDHRDARTQSWIWKRKFVFSGRNFNVVSQHAATRCGIEAQQSWKPDNDAHQQCWRRALTPPEREREILQASAAPGISRHHWGTDFDFFGLNPVLFRTGRYADEYLWMTHNALTNGFFQPYTSREQSGERYMEERWHWSYYPIGQALTEFAADHGVEVGEALDEQWREYESRWNTRGQEERYFDFVRAHWKEFMFNVDTSAVKRP